MKNTFKNILSDRLIILIIVISFLLRIGAVFYLQNYKNPEAWEFGEIAENIVKGNGYSYSQDPNRAPQKSSFQAPVYPDILAFFIKYVPNSYLALEIFQVLISIIAGILLFLCASVFFNKSVGYITLIFYSIHPTFILIPTQFLTLTIYLAQLGFGIYLLIKINEKRSIKLLILFAINSGISLLNDPIFITFVTASAIYWIILYNKNKKELLRILFTTMGITFLIILPWIIRNYRVHHQFVFIKSTFGYNLWRGNHLNATGTARQLDGSNIDDTKSVELKRKLELPEYFAEIKRDNLFRQEAWNFIKSNPGYTLKSVIRKFYYFWWFDPTHPKAKSLLYRLSYLIILIPGLAGILLHRKQIKLHSIFYFHFLLLSGVYSLTMVLPRYHMQIDYILLMFGSYFFYYIAKSSLSKKTFDFH